MKKSEIAMIILIAAGSIVVAYFIAHAIFGGAANQATTVPTVQAINSNFAQPDPTIFNSNAINPTVDVTLGSGNNNSQSVTPTTTSTNTSTTGATTTTTSPTEITNPTSGQ